MADARTEKLIAARRQVSRDKRAHTLARLPKFVGTFRGRAERMRW
jgi:hypothetical protein